MLRWRAVRRHADDRMAAEADITAVLETVAAICWRVARLVIDTHAVSLSAHPPRRAVAGRGRAKSGRIA
jgi:hypothetical protein